MFVIMMEIAFYWKNVLKHVRLELLLNYNQFNYFKIIPVKCEKNEFYEACSTRKIIK